AQGRGHEPAAGRARHGLRDEPDRPDRRDGVRHEADGGHAGRGAGQPGGARRLSRHRALTAPAMSRDLLRVEQLHAGYGKAEVLAGLSLRATQGSVVTVIGPNGAGKSTLLNALMGVLPARGRVAYDDRDLTDVALEERVALGMALVPETRALFGSMPVEDNLLLGTWRLRGCRPPADGLARVYDLFPRLQERRAQLAGTLSGGERQMLAIARALIGEPRLLMLDEPSLG